MTGEIQRSGITRSRTSGGAVAHRPGVAMMFDTSRPKLKLAQP